MAMPAVREAVGVWGEERRVFQDTFPPTRGSGKDSDCCFPIASACRTTGVVTRVAAVELMSAMDVVQQVARI